MKCWLEMLRTFFFWGGRGRGRGQRHHVVIQNPTFLAKKSLISDSDDYYLLEILYYVLIVPELLPYHYLNYIFKLSSAVESQRS